VILINERSGAATSTWTIVDNLGMFAWALGFFFEVVSDMQKMAFKFDESNKGRFITTGLW